MDKIIIKGNGPLRGETYASGAKNAALPILCSSLLAEGEHTYSNVPRLADVATTIKLLRTMGCEAEQLEGNQVKIRVGGVLTPEAPYDLVKTMRASVLVLGPLLARCGRARVSMPGGCAIGARPIDQHLKGLKALGAEIELAEGYVEARAQKLRGAVISFDVITVTGTENVMMAAVLAEGRTVLENAAREPEVEDLALALNQMGAKIQGAGTDTIVIDGVTSLKPARHTVIADRIEVGTLLVAAAITGGDVRVTRAVPAHIEPVLQKLREAGCVITTEADTIHLRGPSRPQPVNIKTQEHPGFPTDMQAQLMALMTVADGTSVISEHIFENRFMHVAEMRRMGADISVEGPTAIVKGLPQLSGAPVMATDLRASASLILAGLRADGKTELSRVYHLDRGYEHLELKLKGMGAHIERIKE